jgi:ATP-dependent RNA helicase RhlB
MSEQVLTDCFFDSFDLHPSLLAGLHESGFTRCTPIQALTLPVALAGRDVAGQAQTGTGKTGAFLVAAMQRLLTLPALAERKETDPRCLVLAPTRELAIQIDKDFKNLGRNTGLKSALIYGGVDYDKQREQLRGGVDIIIATPGRLIDYFKQHVFSLRAVDVMVIDEADRMFDLGFIKDVRFLMRRLPPRDKRLGLLFSATLSYRVLELAYEHMNNPEKLSAETESVTASRVRQRVYFPATEEKMPLLLNLMATDDVQRSIVFVNTKVVAERVTTRLERHGFRVGALSGDVPQKKRQKLLERFQRGEVDVLVATDVAARGLHIPAVSHVFNYDLPHDPEDYVHRIGRTARLGAEGDAISFACDLYAMGLPDIERFIAQKIPVATVTRELLISPPKRERAAHPSDAQNAIDDAADAADAPPPAPTDGKPKRRRSGGRGRSGGGGGRGGSGGGGGRGGEGKSGAASAAPEAS